MYRYRYNIATIHHPSQVIHTFVSFICPKPTRDLVPTCLLINQQLHPQTLKNCLERHMNIQSSLRYCPQYWVHLSQNIGPKYPTQIFWPAICVGLELGSSGATQGGANLPFEYSNFHPWHRWNRFHLKGICHLSGEERR